MSETNTVPEVAFRKGFHRLTAYDMNCQCRAALKTCPACEFEGLQAGKAYYYKPSNGRGAACRREANDAQRPASRRQRQSRGAATHLQGRLLRRFIGTGRRSPRLDWRDARNDRCRRRGRGNLTSAEVRREYPALFVEIPERFANGQFSAVERVTQSLAPPPFSKAP